MRPWARLKKPDATAHLARAARYWHAANIVLDHQERKAEFLEPVGHLISMAAELSLKAYLYEVDDPKTNTHDLGRLLENCIKHGLELSEGDASGLLVMRAAHLEHFHRYGAERLIALQKDKPFTIELADEVQALHLVARLIDLVGNDPTILRNRHQRPALEWPATVPPLHPVLPERFAALSRAAEERAKKIEAFGVPHSTLRPKRK